MIAGQAVRTVKTQVDDETYAKLVKMRKEAGLPSVSALFLKRCKLLSPEHEAQEIFKKTKFRAHKLSVGDEFTIRGLFEAREWEQFDLGARKKVGKLFKAYVASATTGFRAIGKNASNHQIYIVASKPQVND